MTQTELEWIQRILEYGCICCRIDGEGFRPACVHHIIKGGKRLGHLFTIPLCPAHHIGEPRGKVSRHKHHKAFNLTYGGDMALLEKIKYGTLNYR